MDLWSNEKTDTIERPLTDLILCETKQFGEPSNLLNLEDVPGKHGFHQTMFTVETNHHHTLLS